MFPIVIVNLGVLKVIHTAFLFSLSSTHPHTNIYTNLLTQSSYSPPPPPPPPRSFFSPSAWIRIKISTMQEHAETRILSHLKAILK